MTFSIEGEAWDSQDVLSKDYKPATHIWTGRDSGDIPSHSQIPPKQL